MAGSSPKNVVRSAIDERARPCLARRPKEARSCGRRTTAPAALGGQYSLNRPAASDLPGIQRLVDDYEAIDSGEQRPSDWRAAVAYAVPGSAPESNWWVLKQASLLVGFARLWLQSSHEVMAEAYVDPLHVGRGLTARLFDAVEARARELALAGSAEWTPALFTLWTMAGRFVKRGCSAAAIGGFVTSG